MDKKVEMWFAPHEPKENIYPMPMFCSLTVENVQHAADWYVNALGFRVIFAIQDAETKERSFVHLRRERYQDILLRQGKTDKEKNAYGMAIVFQAWQDVDELTRKAKENGALVIVEPHDTAWRTRDVTFQDRDGYRIDFTYPGKDLLASIDPDALSSAVWQK